MPSASFTTLSPLYLLPNTFRAFYGAFDKLHPVQERAIKPILQGKDLIIQSATGSGKTEAVLAPCMERIITYPSPTSMLYIVPTRALAVDIFRRFQTILAERLGLGLAIRTGDLKKSCGGFPALMLTTPESLDVMLGSPNKDICRFLDRTRMVVIDEVHALIHRYRGRHLVYLLQRLQRRKEEQLQKIALSATLSDHNQVKRFLCCHNDTVCLVETVSRQIVPRLVHLLNDDSELIALLDDLYRRWNYQKILIFANSRGRCDKIFGLLNLDGAFRHMVLLHYSNLTAKQRKNVEKRFRKQSRAVCVATSTLELGIDVGDVDAVVLFEPPDSAAVFLQRIGRANRRQESIHFWGICRGERAGDQALRFLSLLNLARKGRVEKPLPKTLPSVLSQQIISCLYEKKRLSLEALKNLFRPIDISRDPSLLEDIFTALVSQKWLRKTDINGIYRGSWRYRDALLDHRIWSNFPEPEEEYSLIVSGEVVADIPLSIVRQLDIGDKVLLTGRRLHILWIDGGIHKRVLAEPTEEKLDEKEIMWVGLGCHVSLETAQAMRRVLKSKDPADHYAAQGLFSRTRRLIEKELETDKRAVILANSIEVVLTGGGLYQYRTFLGAVGNMILCQSVRDYFADISEVVYLAYDEIGLISSCRIRFERLDLPIDAQDFDAWIARHFKTVRAMFALNAFCNTLPLKIMRRELRDFIFNKRLIKFFRRYTENSSQIVKGDPQLLKHLPQSSVPKKPLSSETKVTNHSLLIRAKERCASNIETIPKKKTCYRIRALTGTIIGDFFRHGQCRRRLCCQFLRAEDQPLKQTDKKDFLSAQRINRGLAFEAKILEELQALGKKFHRIAETGEQGILRTFESRCQETRRWLHRACSEKPGSDKRYLAQGVLMQNALLSPASDHFNTSLQENISLKGMGIPDLICADYDGSNFRFEVGDIKSTIRPRYHQKWQIAYYAYLLNIYLKNEKNILRANAVDTGFLLIPSPLDDTPQRQNFDLSPYLASISAVFRNIEQSLSTSPHNVFWRLEGHCVSCTYFGHCYQQALREEDIQFVPGVSHGELLKLRALGLKDLAAAAAFLADNRAEKKKEGTFSALPSSNMPPELKETTNMPCSAFDNNYAVMVNTEFNPGQKERLQRSLAALLENKIIFDGSKTQLFPANTETCFFVHLLNDPLTMRPNALGLAVKKYTQTLKTFIFQVSPDSNLENTWHEFSRNLVTHWQECVAENSRPHIFLFGTGVRQQLYQWAKDMQDDALGNLFEPRESCYWTDLKQIFRNHFALPVPGNMTLFALTHVLAIPLKQKPAEPDSLLHPDNPANLFQTNDSVDQINVYLTTILALYLQLYQWITTFLQSDWNKDKWEDAQRKKQTMGQLLQEFIEAEKSCHEKDIKSLQALSLTQRVERFRALGPVKFAGAALDREGRFLYTFTMLDPQNAFQSKFRQGDFLKLVPAGIEDLQSGIPVILARYDPLQGSISLYLRQKGNMGVNKNISYSLEEDGDDWNTPKLIEVVKQVYQEDTHHMVKHIFNGKWTFTHPENQQQWVCRWLTGEGQAAGLNPSQQTALKLPFKYALSLIQGPPGTGKTNLLGWILIALIRHARESNMPLRIVVSCLTHHAIDQVLRKIVSLVNDFNLNDFPARCWKLGTWEGPEFNEKSAAMQVEPIKASQQVVFPPYLIFGATGYALYNLRQKSAETFGDTPFDWIIFDEASQLLVPQALLSLVHGKGNYLFLGDIHQLPPIIRSRPFSQETTTPAIKKVESEETARLSLLERLMQFYPKQNAFLETTYRMNAEICSFPSRTWYNAKLRPAPKNATAKLALAHPVLRDDPLDTIVDPAKPVVLVRSGHLACGQESKMEADILARIAHHLLCRHKLAQEQLAIISPHRAQNNAVAARLSRLLDNSNELPLIDTVERVQGAERDVIIFGLTCSDPDLVLGDFLNNPNRFNVAITRARKKLIVVASEMFISAVARNEKELTANACFKAFFEQIGKKSDIVWESK